MKFWDILVKFWDIFVMIWDILKYSLGQFCDVILWNKSNGKWQEIKKIN